MHLIAEIARHNLELHIMPEYMGCNAFGNTGQFNRPLNGPVQ
jgi:hypothetical protein